MEPGGGLCSRMFTTSGYEERKKPLSSCIFRPEILRMPLDADKKRIIRHFYRFDQTVGGFSCGDQSICQSFDGLVMGTVDTDGICLADGVESCTWGDGYAVGKGNVVKWLFVGDWKLPGYLAGNILV